MNVRIKEYLAIIISILCTITINPQTVYPLALLNMAIVFLLLFLTLVVLSGMIRGKNKKLNCALKTQEEERRILDKMCMDFTAAYYVELNSGTFEVLHLNAGTNTKKLDLKQYEKFKEFVDQYAEHYLYEKDRQEFQNWFSVEYLQEQLSSKERITYHYRSIPNPELHEFFEAQAVKIYRDEEHFYILVGFRHIDEIMEKETAIQNQLKQALDEVRLNNEIISAIGKNYCSIYRIDVQNDYFDEISNEDETHRLTGNKGCASEKLYKICDTLVAPEYRPLIRPFLNISTLSER